MFVLCKNNIKLLHVRFSCPDRYENAPDTGCQYRGQLYEVGAKIKDQFLPKRCDEECTCENWIDERLVASEFIEFTEPTQSKFHFIVYLSNICTVPTKFHAKEFQKMI